MKPGFTQTAEGFTLPGLILEDALQEYSLEYENRRKLIQLAKVDGISGASIVCPKPITKFEFRDIQATIK